MLTFFFLISLIALTDGYWWQSSAPAWNGLKAGFGFNPFSSTTFASLPRTVEEAKERGWTPDHTVSCSRPMKYRGNRYMKNNDRAAMILFDKNGYVAGIQAGIPKASNQTAFPAPNYHKAFNEDSDMWVVTAYFTNPDKICTTGRSQAEWERDGTGDMLAFQVGPTPTKLMRIPPNESEVTSKTKFVKGKCVYAMGMHYWYELSADLSCDQLLPMFIMYNQGKLNAFGWAFLPNYDSSPRWEHPTRMILPMVSVDPPTCMMNRNHPFTTLHVYMTNSPRLNFC